MPVFKHTYRSDLKITTLPSAVKAAKKGTLGIEMVEVAVKDRNGALLAEAISVVTISADGGYSGMAYGHDTAPEIDLIASIEHKLNLGLLTGFVMQGLVPYGRTPSHTRNKLMLKAAFSGTSIAIAGHGVPMDFADPSDFQIAATNFTANKARFLLMARLLKFGSLPAARNPDKPTSGPFLSSLIFSYLLLSSLIFSYLLLSSLILAEGQLLSLSVGTTAPMARIRLLPVTTASGDCSGGSAPQAFRPPSTGWTSTSSRMAASAHSTSS